MSQTSQSQQQEERAKRRGSQVHTELADPVAARGVNAKVGEGGRGRGGGADRPCNPQCIGH
jgi:hypothetical protein